MEDIKTNKNGKFVVLTFSNESIREILQHTIKKTNKDTGEIQKGTIEQLCTGYERDNKIATQGLRIFNEEWRAKYGKAIRHWMVTELGHNGTENIHMHGVLWTDRTINEIREVWKWGYIWPKPWDKRPNYVNQRSIRYWTKYITKIDQRHKEYKSIILTSPGIGANYINSKAAQRNVHEQTETYKTSTGHEIALPTYWRNKLFTEQDKENLWIKKLDKQERWVNGVRYDISETTKYYERAVQEARRNNKELGYGGKPNDDRKYYEEQQRDLMTETRVQQAIAKAKKTQGLTEQQKHDIEIRRLKGA